MSAGVAVGDLYLAIAAPGASEADQALSQLDAKAKQTGQSTSQAMASFEKATAKATSAVKQLSEAEREQMRVAMASLEQESRARVEAERARNREAGERRAAARAEAADMDAKVRDLRRLEAERNRAANAARRAGPTLNAGVPGARAAAMDASAIARETAAVRAAEANLARMAAAEGVVASEGIAAAGATGLLSGGLTRLAPVAFAAAAVITSVTSVLREYAKEADAARASTNQLRGVAIDTGRSFESVKAEAERVRDAYSLTIDQANALVTATAQLERESAGAAKAQDVLASAFTVAQARGKTNADAIALVESAVKGNAEAIRELTGLKPDELYRRWADRNHIAASSLNEVGKQQALANGILQEGAKLGTEAAGAIDELTAAQQRNAAAQSAFKAAMGDALSGARTWFNDLTSSIYENLLAARRWAVGIDEAISGVKKSAGAAAAPLNIVGQSPLLQFVSGTDFKTLDLAKVKTKAVRDTTDGLISALVTLREQHQQTAADLQTVVKLYDAEAAIIKKGTASIERRAQALERMERLKKAGIVTPDKIIPMTEPRPQLDPTAPSPIAPVFAPEEMYRDFESAYMSFLSMSLGLVSEGEFGNAFGAAMRDQIDVAFKSHVVSGLQSMAQQFATVTTEVFITALDAIAAGLAGGWDQAGSIILGGLGNLLMQMGQQLLVTGATLVGLLPALSNPFTSGPAMLAAGALIFGAGAALSAIAGRGGGSGGSSGGGSQGGGIGSLGIGGEPPNPYAFAAGSRINGNSFTGRTAAEPRTPVTVNATFIGPNDAGAQRAIKQMMSNAERRGIR